MGSRDHIPHGETLETYVEKIVKTLPSGSVTYRESAALKRKIFLLQQQLTEAQEENDQLKARIARLEERASKLVERLDLIDNSFERPWAFEQDYLRGMILESPRQSLDAISREIGARIVKMATETNPDDFDYPLSWLCRCVGDALPIDKEVEQCQT